MRLTKEQAAIIGAYTGFSAGPFADIQDYAEKKLGRPIFTRQFADFTRDHRARAVGGVAEELRSASRDDFLALCYHDEEKA